MISENQYYNYSEKIIFDSLLRMIQPIINSFHVNALLFDKSAALISSLGVNGLNGFSEPENFRDLLIQTENIPEPVIIPEKNAVRYRIIAEKKKYFGSLVIINAENSDDYKKLSPFIENCIQLLTERGHELGNTLFKWLITQNELTLLYDLVEKLSTNPAPEVIAGNLLEQIVKKVKPCYVIIFLPDHDRNLISKNVYPDNDCKLKNIIIEKKSDFYNMILQKSTGDYFNNNQDCPVQKAVFTHFHFQKILYVPLTTSGKLIGLVCIFDKKEGTEFIAGDLEFVASLAGPSSAALDNILLNEELKEKFQIDTWKEISFRAAHKIGNIIFGLRGEIDWLKMNFNEKDFTKTELQTAINRAISAINEANSIVGEFKGYMRPNELQITSADINQIITSAITETENTLKQKNIRVTSELSPHLPEINIDKVKIKQCIKEILENANRFLKTDGEIYIKSYLATSEERQKISFAELKTLISLKIGDNGPGIPVENKIKIFQPFFSTSADGSGLGLSIVKKIMEQHGGDIFEVGTFQKGAVFLLLFSVEKENILEKRNIID